MFSVMSVCFSVCPWGDPSCTVPQPHPLYRPLPPPPICSNLFNLNITPHGPTQTRSNLFFVMHVRSTSGRLGPTGMLSCIFRNCIQFSDTLLDVAYDKRFFEKQIKNNFTYATVTISPNPRAAPLNCAIKITIITSYRQVPSMLTVAPMGHMKRISLLFFRTLFSKQSIVRGKVILLKYYGGLCSVFDTNRVSSSQFHHKLPRRNYTLIS